MLGLSGIVIYNNEFYIFFFSEIFLLFLLIFKILVLFVLYIEILCKILFEESLLLLI